MRCQVWYMNRKGWSRFAGYGAELPTIDDVAEHYNIISVQDFGSGNNEMVALEAIFVAMQGENWSPNGEARPLLEALDLEHTSMSVGDVVRCGDKAWVVAGEGFTPIYPADHLISRRRAYRLRQAMAVIREDAHKEGQKC